MWSRTYSKLADEENPKSVLVVEASALKGNLNDRISFFQTLSILNKVLQNWRLNYSVTLNNFFLFLQQVIIEVTEMLHNASLLVDDIEDNSKLRRGFPVAHSIYGIPSVINCANYVYFLGLEKVLTLDHPDAVKVFTCQLLELHKGQGLDIYWRDTYTCPTEAEYKAMVLQKTGGLFGLAVGLMQLFSSYKKDLKPLLNTLGLFFQIRDDYANLHSKEYSENKSFCEDLTEGKFSFPTIHAIWSRPESTQVQNILRQRTENVDIKKYCVHYLENVGSFEYTRNTLKELEAEAYKQIESLGGNPELVALVEQLSKMFKETEN